MAITAGGGTVLPMPPGISSVLTHPAAVKYSGDARSYQRVFVEGTSRIVVTAWIGRASSQDDRTALASVIRSIAEAPGGGVVDGGTPSAAPPAAFPAVYFPPTFEGADGWHNRDSGLAAAGAGAVAWASTTAFDPADISPKAPAIPPNTIAALPADGIVMVAEVTPWTFDPADGPWPASAEQPLDLSQAQLRGPVAEEPPGNYSVLELDNRYTTVRVYFGTDAPSAALIQQAQAELDRLRVPPVCPTPSKGGYEASLSVDSGAPGDTVTISGPMPIQGPDGSFDHAGQTSIAAWWNVSPGDWTDLAPGATTPPSPAGSGPVVQLGEGGLGACSFTISFTVPQAPPGTYPIVPIEQNPESATSLPALTFRITG
jgi:hypothetical protein